MLKLASLLFGIALSAAAPQSQGIPVSEWEPAPGAMFLVDTKETTGYLVNTDGTYAAVPVVTGQNNIVHYMGKKYLATTPEERWTVKSVHTQGDRITFGPKGTFLRLYRGGEEYTSYGIHSHAYIKQFLESDNPYRSMGCVLVDDAIIEKLLEAYEVNGGSLEVVTVYGLDTSAL